MGGGRRAVACDGGQKWKYVKLDSPDVPDIDERVQDINTGE